MLAAEADTILFSFRAPREFVEETKGIAQRSKAQNVSQYIREAVREKNEREAVEQMRALSQRLSASSLAENRAMESSMGDGLGAA